MKVVKTYTNQFKAELDRALLESRGIFASVLDDHVNLTAGVFNTDLLAIRLVVDDKFYEEALKVLGEVSSE